MHYVLFLISLVMMIFSSFLHKKGSNRKFRGFWEFYPCFISKLSLSMLLVSWGIVILYDEDVIFKSQRRHGKILCFDDSNPLCVGGYLLKSNADIYYVVFLSLILILLGFFIFSDSHIEIYKDKILKRWNLFGFSYKREIKFENLSIFYRKSDIKYGIKFKDRGSVFRFFYVAYPYKATDIVRIDSIARKKIDELEKQNSLGEPTP